MRRFFKILLIPALILGLFPWQISAQGMSSPSFQIPRDSLNLGGFRGTSNTFILEQTAGQFVSERLSGTNFIIRSGFQQAGPRPAPPPAAEPPVQGGGGGMLGAIAADPFPPKIENISVDFSPDGQILVSFETDKTTTAEFHYGIEQLDQAVFQDQSAKLHKVKLEGVTPGVTYIFEIKIRDEKGQETKSGQRSFQVRPLPDVLPPASVASFAAIPEDGKINLNWQNPIDEDFAGIRLVRNKVFYPKDPQDGLIIFEGLAEFFLDQGLINGQRYYYAIFSYDKAGNYSSGVVSSAIPRILKPGEVSRPELPEEIIPEAPPEEVPEGIQKLRLEDFDFIQDGGLRYQTENTITIEPDKPFLILLDYDKVPEVLKTILVTLKQEDGKVFSFLLKIDSAKENYGAKILPPDNGLYEMTFSILDFKNQSAKEIKAKLQVKEKFSGFEARGEFLIWNLFSQVINALQGIINNVRVMLSSILEAIKGILAVFF